LPHFQVTGGLGVHCRGLLHALLAVSPHDQFVVLAPAEPATLFPLAGRDDTANALLADPRVQWVPLDWPHGASLADPLDPVLATPLAQLSSPPDVLLCSYYVGMANPPCPQVVVFHDAGFLENPEGFGGVAERRRAAIEAMRPALHRMMCVSGDSRERVCRLLPFDVSQADVVWHSLPDGPQALRDAVRPGSETAILAGVNESPAEWGTYFFSPVGAGTGFNRRRKNLPLAVRAIRQLNRPDVRLIVATTGILNDRMLDDLLPAEERNHGAIHGAIWTSADGQIRLLPNLAREPFLAALAHASGMVYPSRYEGFGLPTIEAMALGVPVLACRATSLTEVVGDAGLLVDPDDPAALAVAMARVIDDAALRQQLIAAGHQRLPRFTPERMGQAARQALLRVGGRSSSDIEPARSHQR
jgi:glycosyltransferase involved in cell wall biosynthesis